MTHHLEDEVVQYLRNAHAMEEQSLKTVQAAEKVAGDPQLEALYKGHVRETEEHLSHLERLLESRGTSPSALKDAAGKVTAAGLGAGVVAQPDTPGKLLAVAVGFEHFEIASYELLRRLGERAGAQDVIEAVDRILPTEATAAQKLEAAYDLALDASLEPERHEA